MDSIGFENAIRRCAAAVLLFANPGIAVMGNGLRWGGPSIISVRAASRESHDLLSATGM